MVTELVEVKITFRHFLSHTQEWETDLDAWLTLAVSLPVQLARLGFSPLSLGLFSES